jgi:glycosyltransferase involved in cell wall biosynthesis
LLDAWKILHYQGIDHKLHLTVPLDCPFVDTIKKAQKEGVNVVNHGIIPFEQVIELYRVSKAIVYPSHNESLGLGVVEAIEAGCDVIGSNLPFLHSICKPSGTFNPYIPESIAEAIKEYEKGNGTKSQLLINNQINDLINLLVNN